MTRNRIVVALLCSIVTVVFAFTSRAEKTAATPAKDDSAILPFLDDGTFLVARIDVDKVDPDALERFMNEVTEAVGRQHQLGAEDRARQKESSKTESEAACTWLKNMTEAGGRRMYMLVLNSADLREREDDPVVVVPLGDGADADKIGQLVKNGVFGRHGASQQIKNAIVYGKPSPVQRLRAQVENSGQPGVNAADLTAALAAAEGDDAPLRIAVLPGESTRTWIEENLPALPEQVGGGETKLLSRGMRWASVTLIQKPKSLARLTIRGTDAGKAKELFERVNKSLAFATQQLAGQPGGEEIAKQIAAAKPKLQGETISLTFNPVLLRTGMAAFRGASRQEVAVPAPGGKAVPAKPDDGGL